MRRGPRNLKIACDHRGLTHFGGAYFFHEFLQVLQIRRFLAREVPYPRRHHRYSVSQMLLALVYPIVPGLDRIETSSFLRSNGTFQYLTGLPGFPDPQTLRRFLLQAAARVWEHLHRANDHLLQEFIPLPDRRSRLILDQDSTVVTVCGRQDGAEVVTTPSIAASEATIRRFAWRPTVPSSGMPNCGPATHPFGSRAPRCCRRASSMCLRKSASFVFVAMPASDTSRYCTNWRHSELSMQLSPVSPRR